MGWKTTNLAKLWQVGRFDSRDMLSKAVLDLYEELSAEIINKRYRGNLPSNTNVLQRSVTTYCDILGKLYVFGNSGEEARKGCPTNQSESGEAIVNAKLVQYDPPRE